MCLKCIWLKVEHLDISESSSDWAEHRSEAGGAYCGGAYIKKACMCHVLPFSWWDNRFGGSAGGSSPGFLYCVEFYLHFLFLRE